MALQMESYAKSRGKIYNGSSNLRKMRNDCKRLEEGIDAFCAVFLVSTNEDRSTNRSTTKITLLCSLLKEWRPISAELWDTTTTAEHVAAFDGHV